MATDTKTVFAYIGGGFIVALLGGFATLGIQKLTSSSAPAATPTTTATAPAAPAYPMAQVLSVQPHYITKSIPYRACRQIPQTVYSQQPEQYPYAGTIIGGIAGGALGTQIGQGRGRTAAEIGGAVLGALAGNQVQENMNQPQANIVYETHCKTKYAERKSQQGYEVTYVYNGQQGMTIMPAPPASNTIPLPINSGGTN